MELMAVLFLGGGNAERYIPNLAFDSVFNSSSKRYESLKLVLYNSARMRDSSLCNTSAR